jgi:RNA recognition motif-containing protein
VIADPSENLGVFGLSIRTTERDLQDEFSRFGVVSKIVIVYDQQTQRSRGFGFVTMSTTGEAERCIREINGLVRWTIFFIFSSSRVPIGGGFASTCYRTGP